MNKAKLIPGILLIVILAGANLWQHWLKPNPQAPDLTMTTLDDRQISLQSLKGKPVLMVFWATSCGLCLSEIDDLIALHNQYQAKGYTTLAVALAFDSLSTVQNLTLNKPLPYNVIFDKQGSYAQAFGGVQMTPTHFLIAPSGEIVWQNVGPIDRNELKEQIEELLKSV